MLKKTPQIGCHDCNSFKAEFILSKDEHNYFYCLNCGLIFSDNLLIGKIDKLYKFKKENEKELKKRFLIKYKISKKRVKYLLSCFSLDVMRKFKVLDIGCGEGSFLYILKGMDIDGYGIEPNILQSEYGVEKLGLNIVNEYYHKESFESSIFDLITLNRTLEHMPNPYETFDCIKHHLKRDRYVLVDVPTYWDERGNFQKNQWGGGHLRIYDIDTLTQFLIKNNFKIETSLPYVDFYSRSNPGTLCLAKNIAESLDFKERNDKDREIQLKKIRTSLLKDITIGELRRAVIKLLKLILPNSIFKGLKNILSLLT